MRCPWCQKYIEFYLRTNKELADQEREFENTRVKGGYWSSIGESEHDEALASENLDPAMAMWLRRRVAINMGSGETSSVKCMFFSVAQLRDKALGVELSIFGLKVALAAYLSRRLYAVNWPMPQARRRR